MDSKRAQVVMLPTNNISKLVRQISNNNLFFNSEYSVKSGLAQPQYLYFISEDEIKEGDWVYSKKWNQIYCTDTRFQGENGFSILNSEGSLFIITDKLKKIITSTDPSLGLPSIPEEWIKQQVAIGKFPDKVRLEIEEKWRPNNSARDGKYFKSLKLTDKNEVLICLGI